MKKILLTISVAMCTSVSFAQPITGSGTSGQVTYFNGPTNITSNTGFLYNGTQVSIGQSTFPFRLNVSTSWLNDGVSITQTATSSAALHLTSSPAGGHHYALFSTGAAGSGGQGGGGRFVLYDYTAAANRLIVDERGYVGVGLVSAYTLTPYVKFHVHAGSIKLSGTDPVHGAPNIFWGGNLGASVAGEWGLEYNAGMGGMNFWRPSGATGGFANNVLFLSNANNVGIGTATPTAKLEINALGGFKPLNILSDRADWTYGIHYQHQGPSVAHKAIAVSHNSVEIFTVNTNGLVAIGNNGFSVPGLGMAAPPYSLVVGRGILTERVKVALSTDVNWSDYVFDSTYVLNSTDSVERYVNIHKHLPNVPSSSEVHSQGLDVVEMDAALLRQIEELWLHVIELKKENEELRALMNEKNK
jgi:hypothetical protein